jgi:rhodanese-related sulfurtransferase
MIIITIPANGRSPKTTTIQSVFLISSPIPSIFSIATRIVSRKNNSNINTIHGACLILLNIEFIYFLLYLPIYLDYITNINKKARENMFWLKKSKKVKYIGAQEIKDLSKSKDWQIVDIRSSEAIEKGKIENSVKYSEEVLQKDKKIVIVCNQGLGATMLSKKLNKKGYDTFVLEGGYNSLKESENKV